MIKYLLTFLMVSLLCFSSKGPVFHQPAWGQESIDDFELEGESSEDLSGEAESGDDFNFGSDSDSDSDSDFSEESVESGGESSDDELSLDDEVEEESADPEVADEEFSGEEFDEEFAEEEFPAEGESLEPLSETEIQQDELADEEFQDALGEETPPVEPVPNESVPVVEEEGDQEFFPEEEAAPEVAETMSSPQTFEDSGPNLEYEARLHSIYLNFHSSPTAEEEWKTLLGGRDAEIYQISEGDTLWGISEIFFGDGNYWPKIWSLNSKIRNPHLISKGHSIGFVLGNESEAPSFTVTEGDGSNLNGDSIDEDGEGVASSTKSARKEEEAKSGPEIPPPAFTSAPVVKKLPPSLPILRSIDKKSTYGKSGMAVISRKVPVFTPEVTLSSFIDSQSIPAVGSIAEVETGYKVAALFQYVYVKVKAGVARVGDSLLVVRNQGLLKFPSNMKSEGDEYQYQIQGVLKLIDYSKLDRSEESDREPVEHFRALITEMIEPVLTGSQLMEGKIERYLVNLEGPRNRTVAQIIGGSKATNMRLFTEGSIAYLNRGAEDGLAVGQVLAIRENRKLRREYSKVRENLRPIGWLKVLNVSKKYATAVVVQAWDEITIGDLTGLGELLPRASALGTPMASYDSKSKDGEATLSVSVEGESSADDEEYEDGEEEEYVDSEDDYEDEEGSDEYVDEDGGEAEGSFFEEVAEDTNFEESDEVEPESATNEEDVDSLLDEEESFEE
ncbi:MAG: LysM peptidoglycan-binding domain-containing protein [Bdellovibrionales bacterium]|nr:LysM peptidoglycan-binding domain-containing protein [Bdellovibrionales bacterium]